MILTAPALPESDSTPLIFLAGPIQGATNWQEFAAKTLDHPELVIANPRGAPGLNDVNHFQQVDWETRCMTQALWYGVLAFYLAEESEHICSRAYAQTTRFELAETVAKASVMPQRPRIIVGVHPDFPGGAYIVHKLKTQYPFVRVTESLPDFCARTALIASSFIRGLGC